MHKVKMKESKLNREHNWDTIQLKNGRTMGHFSIQNERNDITMEGVSLDNSSQPWRAYTNNPKDSST
jgi:hypothetical protein